MSKIVDHVHDKYLCPVTQSTEIVIIQHTMPRPEKLAVERGTPSVTKKLEYCSGLDTCGVMKTHNEALSFVWDRCPLKATL